MFKNKILMNLIPKYNCSDVPTTEFINGYLYLTTLLAYLDAVKRPLLFRKIKSKEILLLTYDKRVRSNKQIFSNLKPTPKGEWPVFLPSMGPLKVNLESIKHKLPNKETIAAMEEARKIIPRFNTAEELFTSLDNNISKDSDGEELKNLLLGLEQKHKKGINDFVECIFETKKQIDFYTAKFKENDMSNKTEQSNQVKEDLEKGLDAAKEIIKSAEKIETFMGFNFRDGKINLQQSVEARDLVDLTRKLSSCCNLMFNSSAGKNGWCSIEDSNFINNYPLLSEHSLIIFTNRILDIKSLIEKLKKIKISGSEIETVASEFYLYDAYPPAITDLSVGSNKSKKIIIKEAVCTFRAFQIFEIQLRDQSRDYLFLSPINKIGFGLTAKENFINNLTTKLDWFSVLLPIITQDVSKLKASVKEFQAKVKQIQLAYDQSKT